MKSMTGYARGASEGAWGELTLDARCVNHRYLETQLRLPDVLQNEQKTLRERIGQCVKRGKLDITVRFHVADNQSQGLSVNQARVRQIAEAAQCVADALPAAQPIDPLAILNWPGVVEAPMLEVDLPAILASLCDTTLADLNHARESEGHRLKALLAARAGAIGEQVQAIRHRLPQMQEKLRERLNAAINQLDTAVDEQRYAKTLALMAQKADIAEELDRLDSHIAAFEAIVERQDPIGRRLDFLMQEFNREANTLASKAVDTHTAQAAVEIKVLIEQMREQVQNVE